MNQINMDHKVLGFELTFLQSQRPYFNHCSTVLAQTGFIVWPIIKAICAQTNTHTVSCGLLMDMLFATTTDPC